MGFKEIVGRGFEFKHFFKEFAAKGEEKKTSYSGNGDKDLEELSLRWKNL